jgi:hypothetical protein
MDDSTDLHEAVNQSVSTINGRDSEFAWGAKKIGEIIDRTPRQTHHMLSKGLIKSAQKRGGLWVANRAALRREYGG